MTITNESRPSAFSPTNESKNLVSIQNEIKAGSGWNYDEPNLTYDGQFDPITHMPVYYDGIGIVAVITNESKNNV